MLKEKSMVVIALRGLSLNRKSHPIQMARALSPSYNAW
jgi:hypothetical protein